MKIKAIIILLILFLFSSTYGQRVNAIRDGYWSDTATWSNHEIPKPTDSVFINKYVWADMPIIMNDTGFLFIDICGTLCGEQYLSGSFTSYGSINLDSAYITDSTYIYGFFTFTWFIHLDIAQGGYMHSCCGSYGNVGDKPNCKKYENRDAPCTQSVLSIPNQELNTPFVSVSPNPFQDGFTIQQHEFKSPYTAALFSIHGALLQQFMVETNNHYFATIDLQPGVYFLKTKNQVIRVVKQ
jgi:hypothetical protein